MIVVAGPPGSGKSSAFPVSDFGVDFFNVDDVAATLNGGDYLNISSEVRQQANEQCEQFINRHILDCNSFAIETTLRQDITFLQARLARVAGFLLIMRYVVVTSANEAIKRVANRVETGGHPASPKYIRETYHASIKNLPYAIRYFDHVFVFDNSAFNRQPKVVLKAESGGIYFITKSSLPWLRRIVRVVGNLYFSHRETGANLIQSAEMNSKLESGMYRSVPEEIWDAANAAIRILERNPYAGESVPALQPAALSHRPTRLLVFSVNDSRYGLLYYHDSKNEVVHLLDLLIPSGHHSPKPLLGA